MKYSSKYIIYPDNYELGKAIDHYKKLQKKQGVVDDAPDNSVAVQDNFLHTVGNFELRNYGSNVLENARKTFELTLNETSREEKSLDWAALQNSLGNILAALGQKQNTVELFENAIQSFSNALDEFSLENTPLDWVVTQYNLGTAMQALGRQQSDSSLLKKSVKAYTNALLVWSREDVPQDWSLTMLQLGNSFHAYGKLLKGDRTLYKSVTSYKNALTGFNADSTPLEFAATHNNHGVALHYLAESEHSADHMEEAINSYETALTVCMEQQLPIHLAVLCRVNKSTARAALAELTNDAATAEEAADDFELTIECFRNSLQPLWLKHCQEQLIRSRSMVKNPGGYARED